MLDRPDRDIILSDRRRVIERGGRCLQRRDSEAVQVGANKRDPASRRSRPKLDRGVDARMKTDAADADVGADRLSLSVHVHPTLSRVSATYR